MYTIVYCPFPDSLKCIVGWLSLVVNCGGNEVGAVHKKHLFLERTHTGFRHRYSSVLT